jgi:hypothetical protein
MKIGVALSGCDMGGLCAYHILERLEGMGFNAGLISCCCVPSVGAMLHSGGVDPGMAERLLSEFLAGAREDMDAAVARLAGEVPILSMARCRRLALSAVHVEDGRIVTFTNAYSLDTERLRTTPLLDPYDALSATMSMPSGTGDSGGRFRLCDYSSWYGSPMYPLKMSGIAKTLSISFLPALPATPYEALTRKAILESDQPRVHIVLEFPRGVASLDEYKELAMAGFERGAESLLDTLAR